VDEGKGGVRQEEGEELMARLPSGHWLLQQFDDEVILFHERTDDMLVRFNPKDHVSLAAAQEVIAHCEELTGEDRAFAHFWSGYFYAHATGAVGRG